MTVNVEESDIDKIAKLVGEESLYPSRSELIRVACRDFLLKEMKLAKGMQKWNIKEPEIEKFDDKNFVRVPIDSVDKNDEPITEYKTYKILREA